MDPGLCNPSTDEERAATIVTDADTIIRALEVAISGESPARTDWQVIAAWEPQPLSSGDEASVALDGIKRALAGPLEHQGMLGHLTIVRTHLEATLVLVEEAAKKLAGD